MFHRDLTVLSGVTNILGGRAFDVGELLLQGGDNVFGFVKAQGGLGKVGDVIRVGHGEGFDLLGRSHDLGDEGCLTKSANDLIVIVMSDQDKGIPFFGEFDGFDVNLGDQRAGSIDDPQTATGAMLAHVGRDTVGAVDDALAVGDFILAIDKDGAFGAQFVDHEAVVDDLFADVDGWSEGVQRNAHDVDSTNHAGAKAARLEQKQSLSLGSGQNQSSL